MGQEGGLASGWLPPAVAALFHGIMRDYTTRMGLKVGNFFQTQEVFRTMRYP